MNRDTLLTEAQGLIVDFTSGKGASRAKLAAKLEISASVLSHIDNNPALVSDEMLLRIVNALRPQTGFKLVGTANYHTVQAVCRDAQERHKLVGIIGYTGAGKTTALYDYYRSTPGVYMVTAKNIMNRKQFFAEVLSEMGLSYSGTVYDMLKAIIGELNTKESPLLIIDEAGKLSANLVLDLHDLRNATMQNAAVVLAGCEYFQGNLKKAADRQKQGFPEFYSRIINWNTLGLPTKQEIVTISQSNGVSDPEVIARFQRLKNYRDLYNAITNETSLNAA